MVERCPYHAEKTDSSVCDGQSPGPAVNRRKGVNCAQVTVTWMGAMPTDSAQALRLSEVCVCVCVCVHDMGFGEACEKPLWGRERYDMLSTVSHVLRMSKINKGIKKSFK